MAESWGAIDDGPNGVPHGLRREKVSRNFVGTSKDKLLAPKAGIAPVTTVNLCGSSLLFVADRSSSIPSMHPQVVAVKSLGVARLHC